MFIVETFTKVLGVFVKNLIKNIQDQKTIRVLVAEDEPAVAELLIRFLVLFPKYQVIDVVTNGKELITKAAYEQPDVMLVDIEMPELDGISAISALRDTIPDFYTIFITAHTNYAAEAYNLDAVDYLVKPITKERFTKAILRLERFMEIAPINQLSRPERMAVKNNHDIVFVDPDEIIFIEKEMRKTLIHTVSALYPASEPLNSLLTQLNPNQFFRCHKSFIVNVKKIEKIYPIAERIYEITFRDYQKKAPMGRPKYEELLNFFSTQFSLKIT